ncbi:MAG TPA: class I SAM-dependent methyltransferase [Acidimicrobiales bacterium]|nr:class I SAM-dependent methyltransferase [Acidimicrobiales bacterium]
MIDSRHKSEASVAEGAPGASRSHYWEWTSADRAPNHTYLVPGVLRALGDPAGRRLLDLGCGNGALTAELAVAGWEVTGLDFEESGIERARQAHPGVTFAVHDIYQPLPESLRGRFDAVLSAEVIEHLFLPRELFARAREAVSAPSTIVVTTPYHGYAKNLALAVTGKFDGHWVPGSDYGHIKFFSRRTLAALARECGVEPYWWHRVGRIPPLAASMIMTGWIRGPAPTAQEDDGSRGPASA